MTTAFTYPNDLQYVVAAETLRVRRAYYFHQAKAAEDPEETARARLLYEEALAAVKGEEDRILAARRHGPIVEVVGRRP